jgi:hypothetical protein
MKPCVSPGAWGLLAWLAAAPAFGQQEERPERPYRGLFASGAVTEQQLSFNDQVPRPWAWPQYGERQRVSAYLGVWMPLLGQTRRP